MKVATSINLNYQPTDTITSVYDLLSESDRNLIAGKTILFGELKCDNGIETFFNALPAKYPRSQGETWPDYRQGSAETLLKAMSFKRATSSTTTIFHQISLGQ